MPLRIYNTLTRSKQEFVPLIPGEIRMYVCGVTVYDLSHVGHARSAIVFDVIRRYLAFKGYSVRFIKNFTDVDDKIIRRANEEGVGWREISKRYIDEYEKDMKSLGIEETLVAGVVKPKASEHIREMIELIKRLIAQGFAYEVDGDVYFEVRRFPAYGQLSGKNIDELRVGARVEIDERKRDPLDFALWKSSKPGEPAWDSPWGPGRPGWHIECSAMSMHYLRESFDIHGGGEDLIFPHHENEIAQSEAATGKPFVRYWIHNGFVNFGKEKMSKSLGNILLIRNLFEHYHEDALRYYLLDTHYRAPLEFWKARLGDATRAIGHLRLLIKGAKFRAHESEVEMSPPTTEELCESFVEHVLRSLAGDELRDKVDECRVQFTEAMDDDFNTPQALGALFVLGRALNQYRTLVDRGERQLAPFINAVKILWVFGRVLGLFRRHVDPFEPSPESTAKINAIDDLVAQRDEARKRRDWERADELRAEIEALGAIVEDTPAGTRWRWKGE